MLSSYRKADRRQALALAVVGASIALGVLVRPATAQEVSFVPNASATAEWDSNRLLNRPPRSAASYGGDVGAQLWDITPRAMTEVVAQIAYADVPQLNYDWTSGNALLRTDYKGLASEWTLAASYRKDVTFTTEFGQANFNNCLTLTVCTDSNGTAKVTTGISRDSYEVDPGFAYNFTPRFDIEGDFRINGVHYSQQQAGAFVDYTSPYAGLTLNYDTSPRSSVGVGPYFSRYEQSGNGLESSGQGQNGQVTLIGTNTTNTGGAMLDYLYKTSDVTRMTLTARVEENHIDTFGSPSQSNTTWGFEWVGTHKFEVGNIQFALGKFLEPSSIGGRVSLEQVRVQVYRPFTPRLSFTGAVRVTRTKMVGAALQDLVPTEDRTNAEGYLRYEITRRFYVTGGYIFARSRDLGEDNLAYSNGAMITFGYQGLEPNHPEFPK
jgi:hypothetical protein